jgi:hypothetical protein
MRRYAPLTPSSGTRIPGTLRVAVYQRDGGCVGFGRFPGDCMGALELDHVRASHAMGRKSETSMGNLISLCSAHHRWRTENGRVGRAILLAYLEGFR